jgi:molybdopterin converting factor small subunit
MSIKVKLYSDLREKLSAQIHNTGAPSILYIEEDEVNTISEILKKLHIEESEISHIFVNGKYCGPGKKVKNGDQIGIFPKKMAIMFVEIAKNNTISITVKFFADFQTRLPAKSFIDVPEGSTIKSLIKKYPILLEKSKLIILINGKPFYDYDYVLKEGDVVAFFPPLAGG